MAPGRPGDSPAAIRTTTDRFARDNGIQLKPTRSWPSGWGVTRVEPSHPSAKNALRQHVPKVKLSEVNLRECQRARFDVEINVEAGILEAKVDIRPSQHEPPEAPRCQRGEGKTDANAALEQAGLIGGGDGEPTSAPLGSGQRG